MYKIFLQSGNPVYGLKSYLIDSIEELALIPKENMGDSAFVLSNSNLYILNGSLEWKEATFSTSSSGRDGKSAYEIAIDNGFEGTEAEWLISLHGDTPYIGENGNWFIGSIDTGVPANSTLELSNYYSKKELVALKQEEILEICK